MKRYQSIVSIVVCGLAAMSSVALSGCNITIGMTKIQGSGTKVSETRGADLFQKIDVSGAIHVQLTTADQPTVVVSGDDNLVPLVVTEVRGETLYVHTKPNTSISSVHPLQVTVTVPQLTSARVSGASHLDAAGLDSNDLNVKLSGASRLKVTGNVKVLTLKLSGASKADCADLKAEQVRVDTSGASRATVQATTLLSGEASGASKITHVGDPEKVDVDTSGASSVNKK